MKKKRIVAALLAIFLGGFGIHKFYLRRSGQGIFYIFITIMSRRIPFLPLGSILGWIDAYRLLTMDDRAFDRKYNWRYMKKGYNKSGKTPNKRTRRRAKPQRVNNKSKLYKRTARKQLANYDVKEAKENYLKALEIYPDDSEVNFELACVYSLTEETSKSLSYLARSIKLGYSKHEIMTHDLLAYVRIQPAFERFIKNDYNYIPLAEDDVKPLKDVLLKRKVKEKQERR